MTHRFAFKDYRQALATVTAKGSSGCLKAVFVAPAGAAARAVGRSGGRGRRPGPNPCPAPGEGTLHFPAREAAAAGAPGDKHGGAPAPDALERPLGTPHA